MGTDKASMTFGGISLAERAARTTEQALSPDRIRFVAAIPEQAALLSGRPFIFDIYQGRGPVGGLHAALAYSRSEWTFVLACDYPLITAAFLARLAEFINDEHHAIIPRQNDGRLQPLCAFYRTGPCLEVLENTLLSGRSTPPLHLLAAEMLPRIVEPEEFSDIHGGDQFMNANTPADLEAAEKIARKLSDPGEI